MLARNPTPACAPPPARMAGCRRSGWIWGSGFGRKGPLRPRPITARPGLPQRPAANRGPARSPRPAASLFPLTPRPPRRRLPRAPGSGLRLPARADPAYARACVRGVCTRVCAGSPCLPQGALRVRPPAHSHATRWPGQSPQKSSSERLGLDHGRGAPSEHQGLGSGPAEAPPLPSWAAVLLALSLPCLFSGCFRVCCLSDRCFSC